MPFPQSASDFLTHDDSTQRGRDDRITIDLSELMRKPGADIRCDSRVLQEQSALKKLPAVQARAQNEVSVEERSRLAE
jgi:hypothetical protein